MLLYHFTSRGSLAAILKTGLSRGSVPLSPRQDLNAVWLTSDPGPTGHGLDSGGAFMTDEQRQQAFEWSGVMPPPGSRFPKDSSVRLTVEIDENDDNLHEWLRWARWKLPAQLIPVLHPVGSNSLRQAKQWYIYTGVITPHAFVAVDEDPHGAAPRAAAAAPQPRQCQA